jgi:hypothetical protein
LLSEKQLVGSQNIYILADYAIIPNIYNESSLVYYFVILPVIIVIMCLGPNHLKLQYSLVYSRFATYSSAFRKSYAWKTANLHLHCCSIILFIFDTFYTNLNILILSDTDT